VIQELLRLAGRAALDPQFLAYHFQGVEVASICQRLDCSVTTALLLQLSATPRAHCWQADVERLATARGVDRAELAALLRDAEAIRLPGMPVRPA
jgi:hypothetical protein